MVFILSEVLFFFSFFWGVLNSGLGGEVGLGLEWPFVGSLLVGAFSLPFLNSILLLGSSGFVSFFHVFFLRGLKKTLSLGGGILLGGFFFFIQLFEYSLFSPRSQDSVFIRSFFILTGFHGRHVVCGGGLLLVRLYFISFNHLNTLFFEIRVWYWHFVDVV